MAGLLVDNEWGGMDFGRKRLVLNLRSRLGIFMARLSKMAENLTQDLDLNPEPTKYQTANSHVRT
jgi:hypothetical protein